MQKILDKVRIHVYPTPDSTNASKICTFIISKEYDVGDYTNATDVPFSCAFVVSGLAYYLAQKYKPELIQAMKLAYEDELAEH